MPRYFFDSRDNGRLTRDEEGLELDGFEAVKLAATSGLGDWARDAIPAAGAGELSIEVRDDAGRQILRATVSFRIEM